MEARTTIRGSGISRSFVAVCAVVVTMGLGVTAGVVAKNLSAPAAVPSHILQGQGGTLQFSGHRGGVQSIDFQAGPAAVGPDDRPTPLSAPNSFLGPDAQDRNTQLAVALRATKAHGYI